MKTYRVIMRFDTIILKVKAENVKSARKTVLDRLRKKDINKLLDRTSEAIYEIPLIPLK